MGNIMSKIKWFIIAAITVALVGMTVLGFFGFNNTVDYKESYELQVSLEHESQNDIGVMRDTAEKFFIDENVNVVDVQLVNDGAGLIYKLPNALSAEMLAKFENAFKDKVDVTVTVNNVYKHNQLNPLTLLLAYGIAVVAIFVYMLIMNKLASAVAVICSSVISVILYLSMMSITRIPAVPYIEFMAMLAGIIGAAVSVTLVGSYKEKIDSAEKATCEQVANLVAKEDFKKCLCVIIATAIASIALALCINIYTATMGASLMLAGLVSVITAYFITPMIWTAIKGKNTKI